MDENRYMEVDFKTYCAKCKYKNTAEVMDPCNECLDYPMNENSRVPIKYKEAD